MTQPVPAEQIEQIVGARRHPDQHLVRLVSVEQQAYILHSQACLDTTSDLNQCEYSLALDKGLPAPLWEFAEDRPVSVQILGGGYLAPDESL